MTVDGKPNAPMTPREYVDLIAGPTLADFLARRDDRRLAYLACLTVYHCVDALGFAEAARAPGFDALAPNARRRAVDEATKNVREAMTARCGPVFKVVKGMANGTKHPGKMPLLPGTERRIAPFGFEPGCGGFDEGRWNVPGLGLDLDDGNLAFLDACAQQVLAAFVCVYPAHLGGFALSVFDRSLPIPSLDMEWFWLDRIREWAERHTEIVEVWLFGSRAKGTSTAESDVDLALVLTPPDPGHDWPLGNWMAEGSKWQHQMEAMFGRHVSLELFARPGEEEGEPEARATAILLWRRDGAA